MQTKIPTLFQLCINTIANSSNITLFDEALKNGFLKTDLNKARYINTLKIKRLDKQMQEFPVKDEFKVYQPQFINHRLDFIKTISVWLIKMVKEGRFTRESTMPFIFILKGNRNDALLETLWDFYNEQEQQALLEAIVSQGRLFEHLLRRNNVDFCETIWRRCTQQERDTLLALDSLVCAAAEMGASETLKWLWNEANQNQKRSYLNLQDPTLRPLDRSIISGKLEICVWLYDRYKEFAGEIQGDLLVNVLSIALKNCSFDIAKWAWSIASSKEKQQMLLALDVFELTRGVDALSRIQWLFNNCENEPDYIWAIYNTDNCYLFRYVCCYIKTNIVSFLWDSASDEQKKILYSSVNFVQLLESDPEIDPAFQSLVKTIQASQSEIEPTSTLNWKVFNERDTVTFFTMIPRPVFLNPDDEDVYTCELGYRR